jgi:hypothetical protein
MVFDDLVDGHAGGEQLEEVLDRVAQAAHCRLPVADRRVGGDPIEPRISAAYRRDLMQSGSRHPPAIAEGHCAAPTWPAVKDAYGNAYGGTTSDTESVMPSDLVGWAGFEPATSASRTGLRPCYQAPCAQERFEWCLSEPISRLQWRKDRGSRGPPPTLYAVHRLSTRSSAHPASGRQPFAVRVSDGGLEPKPHALTAVRSVALDQANGRLLAGRLVAEDDLVLWFGEQHPLKRHCSAHEFGHRDPSLTCPLS